jgi:hypothetical protein
MSTPYAPLSWKIRVISLVAAVALASSVVATWRFGVSFAKLMEAVERQQAVTDAVTTAPAKRAAAGLSTDPGVLTVGILPPKPPNAAPQH